MITVYVLLSQKDNSTYVGMALNATSRLKEHNAGKNRYTKSHTPWKIIYTEEYPDWSSASIREKYLKSTAGKNWLKKYFKKMEESLVPCLLYAARQGIPYVVQTALHYWRFFYDNI